MNARSLKGWCGRGSGRVAAGSADTSRLEAPVSVWRRISLSVSSTARGDVLREHRRPETRVSVWRRLSSSVFKAKKMVWRRKDHRAVADPVQKPSSMEGEGRGFVSQEPDGAHSKRHRVRKRRHRAKLLVLLLYLPHA